MNKWFKELLSLQPMLWHALSLFARHMYYHFVIITKIVDVVLFVVISKHSCTHFFRTSCRNRLFQFLPYFSIFHRMSFEDFCRYFSKATMCHLMNTSIFSLSKRWHIFKHKNEWKPGSSAGGCVTNQATFFKNPQVLKIIWSVSSSGPCLTGHQLVNHFPLQP